jgi:hypothetical protein
MWIDLDLKISGILKSSGGTALQSTNALQASFHAPLEKAALLVFPHPDHPDHTRLVAAIQPSLPPTHPRVEDHTFRQAQDRVFERSEDPLAESLRALDAYLKNAPSTDEPPDSRTKLQNVRREIQEVLRQREQRQRPDNQSNSQVDVRRR